MGRFGEAIALFERTLADFERVLGADHPDTLTARHPRRRLPVGGALRGGDRAFERTLADFERVLGADHPDTLTARHHLAGAYRSVGRLGEAIALFERTLADFERALGTDHPHTHRAPPPRRRLPVGGAPR